MEGDVGRALDQLMFETVGDYWPPERHYVVDEYRSIPFPFTPIAAPSFTLEESWTLERVAGYARSWSATVRYVREHGVDPVAGFVSTARLAWPGGESRPIVWPLALLAGRVNT